MARYIDAESLKRTFASGIRVYDGMCKIDDIFHNVENEPTADVEEVVRCENCKYNDNGDCIHPDNITHSYDSEWNEYDHYISIYSDHYCGYGEKENKHAHWEYWSGWAGNHDQRIEDATCSNCGYKHPTVRLDYVDGKFIKGYVPDNLAKECPKCGANMRGAKNDN